MHEARGGRLRYQGHLIGLPHAVKNAIERKHLEITARDSREQLEHSAHEWRATFDAINDPVVLLNTHQRIQQGNTAFREMTGKP